jgi:hypothetical protein
MKKHLLLLTLIPVLAACASEPDMAQSQYWERASVSETVYMRGAKAQQMLNRDIARCVTQLRELERLGQLKNAIPADSYDEVTSTAELERLEWDTPERDGALFSEHSDFHDFDGCMKSKGWRRTKHVPYETALRAQENYRANHVLYKDKAEQEKKMAEQNEFSDLNS